MQRSRDPSNPTGRRVSSIWVVGFLAAHAVILLVLVGLLVNYPPAAQWISQAAQAELTGTVAPEMAPTQIATPAEQMRTVSAN